MDKIKKNKKKQLDEITEFIQELDNNYNKIKNLDGLKEEKINLVEIKQNFFDIKDLIIVDGLINEEILSKIQELKEQLRKIENSLKKLNIF